MESNEKWTNKQNSYRLIDREQADSCQGVGWGAGWKALRKWANAKKERSHERGHQCGGWGGGRANRVGRGWGSFRGYKLCRKKTLLGMVNTQYSVWMVRCGIAHLKPVQSFTSVIFYSIRRNRKEKMLRCLKDTIMRMIKQATDCEKVLANISAKDLCSEYIRTFKTQKIKKN